MGAGLAGTFDFSLEVDLEGVRDKGKACFRRKIVEDFMQVGMSESSHEVKFYL